MISGSLDHRAPVEEPPSLVFVDMELVEQAVSHKPQNRVDRRGALIGKTDHTARPLVVAAGVSQTAENLAQALAGASTQARCAQPELDTTIEQPDRQRPVD